MRRFLRAFFGVLIKATSVVRSVTGADISDGKPRIYIANSTDTRGELATFYALGRLKMCLLVSSEEYSEKPALRTVNSKRIIAAKGGICTEWLHDALRRIKSGESILLFPEKQGEGGFGATYILLSLLSGAEIVPIYSKERRGVFRKVRVTVGEPLHPDSAAALTAQQVRDESERARVSLSALAGIVCGGGTA